MKSIKKLQYGTLFLTLFISIFTFSLSNNKVFADTNNADIYSEFDDNTLNLMTSLDKYISKSDNGALIFDIETASKANEDKNVLAVGEVINFLAQDINESGFHDATEPLLRWLFPIGSYGNYCGKGNNGWDKQPIDELDSACREHDKCFKGFNSKSKACNREFVRKLLPIVQTNSATTYKGIYAAAALKLFSSNM